MVFTKQAEFTKKVTDLTDVPSQNMPPSEIKTYFQTPPDELKTTVNKLVDDLNGSSWVDTAKLGSNVVTREKVATGAIGVNEIDPAIMSQPTTVVGVQAALADHTAQLADLANKRTHFQHMGVAFDTSKENSHVAWLHCNVSYDESTDEFIVVYNTQSIHGAEGKTVTSMRKKPKYGSFSDPIVIVDKSAENYSCKTQSSGICANGDYITITNHALNNVSQGVYVYRSTDKGLTWDTGTVITLDGIPLTDAYSGDVSGFRRLSSGRIILWYWDNSKYSHAIYSDDDGYTWNRASMPTKMYVTEPTFIELNDGTIIGYGRDDVTDGTELVKKPAYFLKSTTNGSSWEMPVFSQSITDMSNNNCCFVKRKNSDIIEIIYGSRFKQPDGLGSIYQAITTEELIKQDIWDTSIRIGKGNAIPTTDNGDFGYFGAAMDSDDTSRVFFYNGNKTKSAVNYLVGNTNTAITNNGNTDYKTGFDTFIYNSDTVNAQKGITTGDFSKNIKGFLQTLRPVNGKNLYMELTVASGGQGLLTFNQLNEDNSFTTLSTFNFWDTGNIDLPPVRSYVNSGNYNTETTNDKGGVLIKRLIGGKKIKMDITVDSAGNPSIFATDETDGGNPINLASINLANFKNGYIPSSDKVLSIGDSTHRFKDGYFTGVVTIKADITANRPTTGLQGGAMMFDATLGKPIWRNGSNTGWVDATGTSV